MAQPVTGDKVIEINGQDFLRGMSTGNNLVDGGFSDQSYGINTFVEPGILSFTVNTTEPSTSPIGHIIASTPNDTTKASVDMFFLGHDDTSGDGTYYTWNGSALSLVRTDTTNNYASGKNNIITYRNEIYGTSNEAIVRWTADDATFNVAFQAFGNTSAPHPAIVYEDNAFYADGNDLWRQTTVSTVPSIIMTLVEGTVITAFSIDPGSGKLLIATSSTNNTSDTLPTVNKILYYDGFSNKPSRAVIVDDMVTALYNVGATVYVTYGQNLGFWNGSGIRFLRKLGISFSNESLVYKSSITNIGSTLYLAEGRFIMAFGDIAGGASPSFRYVYRSPVNDISLITNLGQNVLGIGTFTDEAFLTMDLDTISVNGSFFSRRYDFPKPVTFKQITVEYFTAMPTDGNSIGEVVITAADPSETKTLPVVTNTVASKFVHTITYPTITSRSMQLNYTPAQSTQVRRFTILYNDYAA